MRAVLAACLLAGCTSTSAPREPIAVHAALRDNNQGAVVFQDPDGSTRTTTTDDAGFASGELVPGGTVTLIETGNRRRVSVYTDVQTGTDLEFGVREELPPPKPTVSMVFDLELPASTDIAIASSRCGGGAASPGNRIDFDASCTQADLVLVACKRPPDPLPLGLRLAACADHESYVVLPAQPIVAGGHVVVTAAQWLPMPSTQVALTGGDGVVHTDLTLTTAWGLSSDLASDVTAVHSELPLLGPSTITGLVERASAAPQQLTAHLPADATSLDLRAVLAPWLAQDGTTWTTDDAGGALVADALVTSYYFSDTWLDIYSAPGTSGQVTLPDLPREVTNVIVGADTATGTARLVRVVGADPSLDPQRLANIVVSGGDPGGTSLAITSFVTP